jgi:hypothetical protein
MRCDEARERILEADLDELSAGAGSPLQRHLAHCPDCAAAARAVLDQERALGATLGAVRGSRGAEHALTHRRSLVGWRRAGVAALALAAGLAGLLLLRRPAPPEREPAVARPAEARVEVSVDRPFVILSTGNPDVTLVWLN